MGTAASKRRADRNRDCLLQTLDDHESAINCMALSNDTSVLATGSDDHQIRLWSTKTTPVECLCVLSGHTDYITHILMHDNYLISASADQTMRKWDVTTAECVLIYTGHTSLVNRVICTGKWDLITRLFDEDVDRLVVRKTNEFFSRSRLALVSFNQPSSEPWKSSRDNSFLPMSTRSMRLHRRKQLVYRPLWWTCLLGKYLLSTSYDRTARCWDFQTGACIRIFRGHKHGVFPILFLPSSHDASAEDDFEQEMNIYTKDTVITGSQDTTAKSWSLETGDCLKTFTGHIGAILCLAIDAQGKLLFTGSGDNSIRAWDIQRGSELRVYDQHQGAVIQLIVRRSRERAVDEKTHRLSV